MLAPIDGGILAGPLGRALCFEVAAAVMSVPTGALSSSELAAALRKVPMGAFATVSGEKIMDSFRSVVDAAQYRGEDDALRDVLASPEPVDALRPIADELSRRDTLRWWHETVAREQWILFGDGRDSNDPFPITSAALLEAWRRDFDDETSAARRARPRSRWTGHWWSFPRGIGFVSTTRALSSGRPVQAVLEEDRFDRVDAPAVSVAVTSDARVFEIDEPAAWQELVATFPLDASSSRGPDWDRFTSLSGPWLIPDWEKVADQFDGVHLTAAAYLETAGRPLPVPHGTTILAGGSPDETLWLNDHVLTVEPRSVLSA